MVKLKRASRQNKGMSLIEVILAVGLFSLFATALVGLLIISYGSNLQAAQRDQASFYVQEGLEAVGAIRRQAWNYLIDGSYGLTKENGYWEFSGESDLIDDRFTRVVTISSVCRDGGKNIIECDQPDAKIDLYSKKVAVDVSYTAITGVENDVDASSYLTAWQTKDWQQTDWSAGTGQENWSNQSAYSTDSGTIDFENNGELKLAKISDLGSWSSGGGNQFTDTTDSDFNAGSFNQTVVYGSDVLAGVTTNQGVFWASSKDSRIATTYSIRAVDMVSATDGWAVGDNGVILHYDGSSWSLFADLGDLSIRTIKMVSATDGWAAGSGGRIYHYDGSAWSEFIVTGGQAWYAISVLSADDVWLSGSSGQIYHYDGSSWSKFVDTGGQAWYAIDMVSTIDGWVVGNAGIIYHYDGTSWTQFIDTGDQAWRAIDMVSATDGWVVGSAGSVYHYDGSAWTESIITGTQTWYAIDMVSSTDGWISSNGGYIYHYDGNAWTQFIDTGGQSWYSIGMTSPTSGWVLGNAGYIYQYNSFFNKVGTFESKIFDSGKQDTIWNSINWTVNLPLGSKVTLAVRTGDTITPDETWTDFTVELSNADSSAVNLTGQYAQYRATLTNGTDPNSSPQLTDVALIYDRPTDQNLNDLAIVNDQNIWAVGNAGTIIHYDGSDWLSIDSPTTVNLRGVAMPAPNDGWAVGDSGKILHYDGTDWTEYIDFGSISLRSIYMLSTVEGWAVGNSGRIYHYSDGSWSQFADTGTQVWYAVAMVSDSEGWIVGNGGEIYYYNGATWEQSVDTGDQAWYDISILADNDVWVSGNGGEIYHYDGENWLSAADTGGQAWYAIYMIAPDDGWILGNAGRIFHYDGSNWTQATDTGGQAWYAVAMDSPTKGWAVGSNGEIISFDSSVIGFEKEGWLISSAFDMATPSAVNVVSWNQQLSDNSNIKLQIRTAPDNSGTPGSWSSWYGTSSAGGYFTDHDGQLAPLALNFNQWLQYRVELSGDGNSTPILQAVKINYLP
ncbi:MAG: hypothetical protein JW816_03465 [Candidatus Buchananbacteria bacterium]|nr:hypothetical protein [Candidatus Buchananbacteria bacterium]